MYFCSLKAKGSPHAGNYCVRGHGTGRRGAERREGWHPCYKAAEIDPLTTHREKLELTDQLSKG